MQSPLIKLLRTACQSKKNEDIQLFVEAAAKKWFHFIYLMCYSYLGNDTAQDATQDTFLKISEKTKVIYKALLEKQSTLKEDESLEDYLREYLGRMARNVVIDGYHRKKKHLETIDERTQEIPAEDQGRVVKEVMEAVKAFPENLRKPIEFKYVNGWSSERIADELEMSTKTVDKRLKKGLAMLKARFAA